MIDDLVEAGDQAPARTTISLPIISRDLADLGTPGVQVEITAEIAEELGLVEETALSLSDIGEDEFHGN